MRCVMLGGCVTLLLGISLATAKPVRKIPENRQELLQKADKALREAFEKLKGARGSLVFRALEDIAALQAQMGLKAESKKAFALAREMIDARAGDGRFWDYRELARAHGRAGDSATVIEIITAIPDEVPNYRGGPKEFRAMVLQESLLDMIKHGGGAEALKILDQFKDTKDAEGLRQWIAHDMVMQLAWAGKLGAALRAVDDLKSPAWQIRALLGTFILNESYGENPQRPGIAVLQAARGDKEEAEKSVERAVALFKQMPPDKRDYYNASLVCTQAQLGDWDAARTTLAGITEESPRKNATAMFVRALGAKGKTREAAEWIDRQTDPAWRVYLLLHLALGQAHAGDANGARATTDKGIPLLKEVKDKEQRSTLVHNFASAQAEVGDADGAVQTLGLRPSVNPANIAYSLATAGAYDRALKIAETMKDGDWWTGNVYRAIAKIQAHKRDEKGASAWINKLPSSHSKGNALLGMAEGLLERTK